MANNTDISLMETNLRGLINYVYSNRIFDDVINYHDMAKKCGMSAGDFSEMRNGERKFPEDRAAALALLFNVTADELMSDNLSVLKKKVSERKGMHFHDLTELIKWKKNNNQ